jgi:hypothetical protein
MRMFGRWMAMAFVVVVAGSCGSGGGGHEAPDMDAAPAPADITVDAPGEVGGTPGRGSEVADHTAADVGADAAETGSGPPARTVAIGDLHGDLEAARSALRLAGVIDTADQWIGGTDVVVQTGDLLDRWYLERELVDWLEEMRLDAVAAGGDMIMLAGNHEDNNLEEYYPDVDPDSCPAYADVPDDTSQVSPDVTQECRKRAASYLPGGSYAMKMAGKKVAVIVGDSAFVHGGLRPEYVTSPASIHDMNVRWAAFAKGEAGTQVDEDIYETMWDRSYSDDDEEPDCASLATVLAALGVSRMVVGHSRWGHINSACDGMVWRIDTGMSAYYGGNIEVLEITESGVTPLAE